MIAANTRFERHSNKEMNKEKLVTWVSPNRKIKRQIDYIMVNNQKINWVENAYTSELMNKKTESGHKMVVIEIMAKYKKREKKLDRIKEHIKYDIQDMRENIEELTLKWGKIDKKIKEIKKEKHNTSERKIEKIWDVLERNTKKFVIEKFKKKTHQEKKTPQRGRRKKK